MPENENNLSELAVACQNLLNAKQTLLLSSLNQSGDPEISYAPYYRAEDGAFYVFISELAAHTRNLKCHPRAAVLFIADEQESVNLFARERLSYQCEVSVISKDEDVYVSILDSMEAKFGNIMSMLRTLQDFQLFRLLPTGGTYVVGFGKAYEVNPVSGKLEHISEEKLKKNQKSKSG